MLLQLDWLLQPLWSLEWAPGIGLAQCLWMRGAGGVEVAVTRQQGASGHGGNLCRSSSQYHKGTSLSIRLGSTGNVLL